MNHDPYAAFKEKLYPMLPLPVTRKIDLLRITANFDIHIEWRGQPKPKPLIVPLHGTQLDYDSIAAYITLNVP